MFCDINRWHNSSKWTLISAQKHPIFWAWKNDDQVFIENSFVIDIFFKLRKKLKTTKSLLIVLFSTN